MDRNWSLYIYFLVADLHSKILEKYFLKFSGKFGLIKGSRVLPFGFARPLGNPGSAPAFTVIF